MSRAEERNGSEQLHRFPQKTNKSQHGEAETFTSDSRGSTHIEKLCHPKVDN